MHCDVHSGVERVLEDVDVHSGMERVLEDVVVGLMESLPAVVALR
jgi:hypothetical protein